MVRRSPKGRFEVHIDQPLELFGASEKAYFTLAPS